MTAKGKRGPAQTGLHPGKGRPEDNAPAIAATLLNVTLIDAVIAVNRLVDFLVVGTSGFGAIPTIGDVPDRLEQIVINTRHLRRKSSNELKRQAHRPVQDRSPSASF